jgi:hypothetical protein
MSFGHNLKYLKEFEKREWLSGPCEVCRKRSGVAMWSYYKLIGDSGRRVPMQKLVCATCGELAKRHASSRAKEPAKSNKAPMVKSSR